MYFTILLTFSVYFSRVLTPLRGRMTICVGREWKCTLKHFQHLLSVWVFLRLLSKYKIKQKASIYFKSLSFFLNKYASSETYVFFFRLCFVKLKLLLLAIEVTQEDGGDCKISINPKSQVKLTHETQGFFIAQSADEAKR